MDCKPWLSSCGCGLVLLLACFAVQATSARVAIQLELQSDVTVSGQRLKLIDLAAVHADSPGLQNELEQTLLGATPRVGTITRLTRQDVEHALRGLRLERGLRLTWSGAAAVNIRLAQQTIAAARVIDVAQQGLIKALTPRFQQVDLTLASTPGDLALPLGQVDMKLRQFDDDQLAARMPVWLDVNVDGVFYRAVSFVFTVRANQLGYVARRDLAVGVVASEADFVLAPVEVASNLHSVMAVGHVQDGMAVRKPIVAGQVLLRGQLAQKGMVLRGDVVALKSAQGAVLIETRAVVQQDAVLGQLAKVRPEHGSDTILARVRSSTLVQID